jgi:hypothetical protein
MSLWHVELTCNDRVPLSFLATHLQETVSLGEQLCSVLEKECGYVQHSARPELIAPISSESRSTYYLLSSEFTLQNDAYAVFDRANNKLLPLLNALTALFLDPHVCLIKAGQVYLPDQYGRLIQKTAILQLTGGELQLYESVLHVANARHAEIMKVWLAMKKDRAVEDAMLYYTNQMNWFNLYKVYEVIEHDVRRDILNKWTQGRAEDFTYSANNARVSGYDARHSSAKYPKASSKRSSMSLQEAFVFVTDLLLRWLQTKPS